MSEAAGSYEEEDRSWDWSRNDGAFSFMNANLTAGVREEVFIGVNCFRFAGGWLACGIDSCGAGILDYSQLVKVNYALYDGKASLLKVEESVVEQQQKAVEKDNWHLIARDSAIESAHESLAVHAPGSGVEQQEVPVHVVAPAPGRVVVVRQRLLSVSAIPGAEKHILRIRAKGKFGGTGRPPWK